MNWYRIATAAALPDSVGLAEAQDAGLFTEEVRGREQHVLFRVSVVG